MPPSSKGVRIRLDRPEHWDQGWRDCNGIAYAEPGRSYVDLERGIFYRKPIGKRATKKRQTPAAQRRYRLDSSPTCDAGKTAN